MKPTSENRIWLFSFADLAFVLLIAFTQASTIGKVPVSIGEMTLPKVVEGPSVTVFPNQVIKYQIRIHKPDAATAMRIAEGIEGEETRPFQIIAIRADGGEIEGPRISAKDLYTELQTIRDSRALRPVLIPDEMSLSKDMLLAMSLVEKMWEETRTVTVEKVKTLE